MTTIEQALFRNSTAHCISAIDIANDVIAITLHPWERPELTSRARFEGVKILSVDNSYADTDAMELPWDIIGFDSDKLSDDMWRYCLHTDAVEYCFESKWPAISKTG